MVGFKTSLGHKTAKSKSLEVKGKYKSFHQFKHKKSSQIFIHSKFVSEYEACRSSFAKEMYSVLEVFSLKMN